MNFLILMMFIGGSLYRDKRLMELVPDDTSKGHPDEASDLGELERVEEVSKMLWLYHYHFAEATNHS